MRARAQSSIGPGSASCVLSPAKPGSGGFYSLRPHVFQAPTKRRRLQAQPSKNMEGSGEEPKRCVLGYLGHGWATGVFWAATKPDQLARSSSKHFGSGDEAKNVRFGFLFPEREPNLAFFAFQGKTATCTFRVLGHECFWAATKPDQLAGPAVSILE